MKLQLTYVVGFCIASAAAFALAGGGPENVLLVVNNNSEASKTIANNYIHWRQIPACNVVYIDWTGSLDITDAITFRDKILMPALMAMDKGNLAPQIDYIVYSSDFPWRIDMNPLFPGQNFTPVAAPYASLNGATYLAPYILSQNPAILLPDINWYVPAPQNANLMRCQDVADAPSHGFRSRYLWDSNGNKTTGVTYGQRYLLSTMLAVTHGRGNSVEEALNYLRRAVAADGSNPQGTIYYMWNKDVRSTTRDKCFPAVAAKINASGARAVVQQGILPTGAKDVAGLMVGASDFDLAKEGIHILPGAICEHLTSAGGIMESGNFQTPLSEFLRHGAAGASGTVVEPLAVQAKFPLASIQLHYVRGCSLAEAFYQSVSGPYQLLIVGDPLCQPWASARTVNVAGVKPDDRVKGSLSITPSSTGSIRTYELFVDGHLDVRAPAGNAIPIDTTQLADGHHELRIVGYRSDAIETQGRRIVPIVVNNHDAAVELKIAPGSRVGLLAKLKLSVRQPGATAIVIRQNNRDLARVQGESGDVEVPAATLGSGPTMLQAFSEGKTMAASAPVHIVVE